MRKIIPSKKLCEEFYLTYELQGVQKAVNFLARYYKIRRMKIVVDGRKVGNSDDACYGNYTAYFKKKKINKLLVLHEFYHHLVYVKGWEFSDKRVEIEAERYAREVSSSF